MKVRIGPWLPMLFCAALSAISVIFNLYTAFMPGGVASILNVFYCFLPMCFFFVGVFFVHLQKENQELRSRLDRLFAERAV